MQPDEGYWTSHFAVEASAVQTYTAVPLLQTHLSHYFDVLALATSRHTVHHKHDRHVFSTRLRLEFVYPV
jgi:hypothetical protein